MSAGKGGGWMAYGPRSVKRLRRTKAAMGEIHGAILEALAQDDQMTVRQIFYCLVSSGAIEKTELQYRAVMRALSEMRRDGRIPFGAVADNTRAHEVRFVFEPGSGPSCCA